jgi:hypothetical protein
MQGLLAGSWRSHLVVLRPMKISASDPPAMWWPRGAIGRATSSRAAVKFCRAGKRRNPRSIIAAPTIGCGAFGRLRLALVMCSALASFNMLFVGLLLGSSFSDAVEISFRASITDYICLRNGWRSISRIWHSPRELLASGRTSVHRISNIVLTLGVSFTIC